MADVDWDGLFDAIAARYETLRNPDDARSFLDHVKHLGAWNQPRGAHPDETPTFPDEVHVAYAVCHKDCGVKEFIVDGSTQECQRCGRLMFRTDVRRYVKAG